MRLVAGGGDSTLPLRGRGCFGSFFAHARPDVILRNPGPPVVVRLFATPGEQSDDIGIVCISRGQLPRCFDSDGVGRVEETVVTLPTGSTDLWLTIPSSLAYRWATLRVVAEGLAPVWDRDFRDLGSAVGRVLVGSTAAEPDHVREERCPANTGDGARDAVVRWRAPEAGTYGISTAGSDFDTLLYAWRWDDRAAAAWCNDDVAGDPDPDRNADAVQTSYIVVPAHRGEVFAVVVDGAGGTDHGKFVLTIKRLPDSAADAGAADAGK
jgi:hypothetical protein